MAQTTYTLEYNGEIIAHIPAAGYATPSFTGKIEFIDEALLHRLVKVQDFEVWVEEGLPDDAPDEDFYAAMAEQGVDRADYEMWNGRGWLVRGSDGSVSKSILNLDTDGIEWRPDPETPKNSAGSKGFFGLFKR